MSGPDSTPNTPPTFELSPQYTYNYMINGKAEVLMLVTSEQPVVRYSINDPDVSGHLVAVAYNGSQFFIQNSSGVVKVPRVHFEAMNPDVVPPTNLGRRELLCDTAEGVGLGGLAGMTYNYFCVVGEPSKNDDQQPDWEDGKARGQIQLAGGKPVLTRETGTGMVVGAIGKNLWRSNKNEELRHLMARETNNPDQPDISV